MWFVFFKQKTAYELRISDWSSDVCSSDLFDGDAFRLFPALPALFELTVNDDRARGRRRRGVHDDPPLHDACGRRRPRPRIVIPVFWDGAVGEGGRISNTPFQLRQPLLGRLQPPAHVEQHHPENRSEEHTPELQSLMRISY